MVVEDVCILVVNVFDCFLIFVVEKVILIFDLGLNLFLVGIIICVLLFLLIEECCCDLIKIVKGEGE